MKRKAETQRRSAPTTDEVRVRRYGKAILKEVRTWEGRIRKPLEDAIREISRADRGAANRLSAIDVALCALRRRIITEAKSLRSWDSSEYE